MKTKQMTLQLQPNSWSCLATAFAMCLDVNVVDLIKSIGHDGSEIMFPELGERGRRGHHIQELLDYCIRNGVRVVTIDALPLSMYVGTESKPYLAEEQTNERFADYIANYYGVFAGTTVHNVSHAVAWNGKEIYNPAGIVESSFEHLQIMYFFIVGKL